MVTTYLFDQSKKSNIRDKRPDLKEDCPFLPQENADDAQRHLMWENPIIH